MIALPTLNSFPLTRGVNHVITFLHVCVCGGGGGGVGRWGGGGMSMGVSNEVSDRGQEFGGQDKTTDTQDLHTLVPSHLLQTQCHSLPETLLHKTRSASQQWAMPDSYRCCEGGKSLLTLSQKAAWCQTHTDDVRLEIAFPK